MKRIVELIKWDSCGTGEAEKMANELASGVGAFNIATPGEIDCLFALKNIPLKTLDGAEYYVYYNYHPSSGYKTILHINDSDEIAFNVESCGFGLSAIWNEVIVFTVQDGWH